MNILYDRSVSIRDSVSDVKFTLFLALILVILVIFLFLRMFRDRDSQPCVTAVAGGGRSR